MAHPSQTGFEVKQGGAQAHGAWMSWHIGPAPCGARQQRLERVSHAQASITAKQKPRPLKRDPAHDQVPVRD